MRDTPLTEAVHEKAVRIIRENDGLIRTNQALRAGIHPRTLYVLRDHGELEQISRGIFRLNELPSVSNPDLVAVALRIPRAVVCLVSALAFHDLTTQIPHEVSIALEQGAQSPRLHHPPVTVHRFSKKAFAAGIEAHQIDGVKLHVYDPEKTLADCFKFRNKLGMEIVLEALKLYKTRRRFKPDALLKYARICRMEKVMTPYLEAVL